MSTTASLLDLPEEVLYDILGLLPDRDLFRIAAVSKDLKVTSRWVGLFTKIRSDGAQTR